MFIIKKYDAFMMAVQMMLLTHETHKLTDDLMKDFIKSLMHI